MNGMAPSGVKLIPIHRGTLTAPPPRAAIGARDNLTEVYRLEAQLRGLMNLLLDVVLMRIVLMLDLIRLVITVMGGEQVVVTPELVGLRVCDRGRVPWSSCRNEHEPLVR